MNAIKIAISKASGSPNYARYIHWINTAAERNRVNVECVDLATLASTDAALQALNDCAGFVLTGGPDVHPQRYGKEEELSRCSIDAPRDDFEFALYARAQELKLPVLGVCRGAQVLNVAHGGTLVIDIPSDTGTATEHARINDVDSMHPIIVESGSILVKITGELEGRINSAHHQAVANVGDGLRINSSSEDGIHEGIEWHDSMGKPFLLGVQWHPERMEYENPFSLKIAQHFIFEAESYSLLGGRVKSGSGRINLEKA